MSIIASRLRSVLLSAALSAAVSLCLPGCGGGDDGGGGSDIAGGANCTDGGTCKSDVMPDGKTWMTENLNISTSSGSWCYGDSPDNCAKYGRLYTWAAARTACQGGWHLPSRQEWDKLLESVGGTKSYGSDDEDHDWRDAGNNLKTASGWKDSDGRDGNGTDDAGFSALPGGVREPNGGFSSAGGYGAWWTAAESGSGNAYFRDMAAIYSTVYEHTDSKGYGKSVRCIAD